MWTGSEDRSKVMPTPRPPARIHVVLARAAPRAVVWRRGPSRWTRLLLWHTDTDVVEPGQWFKGLIRENDLSPDGTKLIYTAERFHGQVYEGDAVGPRWTALSRPPFLTALALWRHNWNNQAQDTGSFHGEGAFLDDTALYFDSHPRDLTPYKGNLPAGLRVMGDERWTMDRFVRQNTDVFRLTPGGEAMLNGWERGPLPADLTSVTIGKHHVDWAWQRRQPSGSYLLVRWFGHRVYDELGRLRLVVASGSHATSTAGTSTPARHLVAPGTVTANWADWDYMGQLLAAGGGRLLRYDLLAADAVPRVVADLNDQTPTALVAPEWATVPSYKS